MAVNHNGLSSEDCFEGWWNTAGTWVEAPNERRGGFSGVQLVELGAQAFYCKRQVNHLCYSWRHPLREPTVFREVRASMALHKLGIEVPTVVFYGARKQGDEHRALLVTESLAGFISLEEWYARGVYRDDDRIQKQVMTAIGEMIARLHCARWQHGCLYPKHIFVRIKKQDNSTVINTALLDLEKCRQRLTASSAARRDLWQLFRRREAMPEVHWRLLLAGYWAQVGDSFRLRAADRNRWQFSSS